MHGQSESASELPYEKGLSEDAEPQAKEVGRMGRQGKEEPRNHPIHNKHIMFGGMPPPHLKLFF